MALDLKHVSSTYEIDHKNFKYRISAKPTGEVSFINRVNINGFNINSMFWDNERQEFVCKNDFCSRVILSENTIHIDDVEKIIMNDNC